MTAWLSLALGLVKIINMVMSRLDAAEKMRVATALVEAENLKLDMDAIARAKAVAASVNAQLNTDAAIMTPDADMRP